QPKGQLHDGYTTRSIHVGSEPDPISGAVVPGLSVATTFVQDGVDRVRGGHDYSRSSNPTRSILEELITSLETTPAQRDHHHDQSGGESLVFASGSAATAALASWVSLATVEGGAGGSDGSNGGGGHILAINDVYGGTARYLSRAARSTGLEVTYFDFEKAGEQEIRAAIRPDTRLIWLEVPTNPLLIVPPLPLIAEIVNSLPQETRPLIVVDTTFLSSFYFTPLVSQAPGLPPVGDIVLSSLSKYSGGHSDIILGSLTIAPHARAIRPHLVQGLRFVQNSHGGIPSPRDCHLMVRSLKTLSVRTLRHGLGALRVAHWLSQQPEVDVVRYPGLASSPAFHHIEQLLSPNARRELEFLGWSFPFKPRSATPSNTLEYVKTIGIPFGGVITFTLKDASEEQTDKFVTNLRLIALAESLGGVESLIEVPYGMTHKAIPADHRAAIGITPNLVRLSVGIEDVEDLIADLERGLQ
ncbi:CGL lyase, partial [Spelaeornis formosus]|nr:CGL lyase [Elachura formosa]